MNQPTPTPNTAAAARPATTERAIAWATTLAPIATGVTSPYLDGSAAILGAITYGGAAGFLAANYMNRLPDNLLHQLPAGDIIRAHRTTLFGSTLTTGMALLMGAVQGPEGADALMAGVAGIAYQPVPGIVSLGWWAAVGLVPYKLRKVLASRRKPKHHPAAPPGAPAAPAVDTPAKEIAYRWRQIISHPDTGTHRGQNIQIRTLTNQRWTGIITARPGQPVTVTADTVSSAYQGTRYQVPAAQITFTDGAHSGERHITVHLIAPPEMDTRTLAGAWKTWAARSGGVMAGTHLEDVQPDPHTGGEVAYVVANADTDSLPTPNIRDLVGALRTRHVLLSYEPSEDPRTAVIRLMKENPLRGGIAFPGPEALKPSPGGYFRIGAAVSGRPLRAQLLDPKLGARHLYITGVTGSGKGGVLQLIALAAHLAGAVIIYADPKGSSNPAIETMAAYTGLGEDGAMGALLLAEALVNHRIDLTGQLKQKNFNPQAMPHVVFILDEAATLLGEKAKHRKRASAAVAQIAKKGRSMGVSEVLANQLLQLAELGGDSAIRDNIVGSGGVIMLRADSSQRHLIDLPPGLEDVNPADIPATWTDDGKAPLVYTDDVHIQDPESTFGLGYYMTTDRVRAMGRTYDLEDATEYVDPTRIMEPFDWPGWGDRHNLVAQMMAGDDEEADFDDAGLGQISLMPTMDLGPRKPANASDKILKVLADLADPAGIDINYVHRDNIQSLAKLELATLENTLSKLIKAGKIHRQVEDGKEVRGMYGPGPAPAAEAAGE